MMIFHENLGEKLGEGRVEGGGGRGALTMEFVDNAKHYFQNLITQSTRY